MFTEAYRFLYAQMLQASGVKDGWQLLSFRFERLNINKRKISRRDIQSHIRWGGNSSKGVVWWLDGVGCNFLGDR